MVVDVADVGVRPRRDGRATTRDRRRVIRGLVRTQVGDEAVGQTIYTRRDDWFSVLADDFGLRFDASPPDALERLWERVQANHRDWEAREGEATTAGTSADTP